MSLLRQQVVSHVAVCLSGAVLLWLRGGDDDELMKAVWEAVEAPRGVGLDSMSAKLCSLIYPDGRSSSPLRLLLLLL